MGWLERLAPATANGLGTGTLFYVLGKLAEGVGVIPSGTGEMVGAIGLFASVAVELKKESNQ